VLSVRQDLVAAAVGAVEAVAAEAAASPQAALEDPAARGARVRAGSLLFSTKPLDPRDSLGHRRAYP
jgi:hypothetical protein